MMTLFARLALGGALLLGALVAGDAATAPGRSAPIDELSYAWNCDGTLWGFRASRLPDGRVGLAYARVQAGAPRNPGLYQWTEPTSLGGRVERQEDLAITCLAGKLWVFARLTGPSDGTGQLYERHAYPEDAANGTDQGWGAWYHWR